MTRNARWDVAGVEAPQGDAEAPSHVDRARLRQRGGEREAGRRSFP